MTLDGNQLLHKLICALQSSSLVAFAASFPFKTIDCFSLTLTIMDDPGSEWFQGRKECLSQGPNVGWHRSCLVVTSSRDLMHGFRTAQAFFLSSLN